MPPSASAIGDLPASGASQMGFLMYRDMAVLSLPLIALAPLGLYVAEASRNAKWPAGGMFFVQYVLTAVSERHAGERLLCNVLALHAAKKITAPKSSAGRKDTE